MARDGTASTPESITHALREDLLDGVPSPGSRLTEEALCARFMSGRHSVRAGLQILVSEGLLEHRRNKGILVPEVTEERIDEMRSYRAILELGALSLALGRAADFADVASAVTHLESLADDTPWRHVIEAHSAVHRAIVEASANGRLVAAHRACENELNFMLATSGRTSPLGGWPSCTDTSSTSCPSAVRRPCGPSRTTSSWVDAPPCTSRCAGNEV